jgi:hypothetical protein
MSHLKRIGYTGVFLLLFLWVLELQPPTETQIEKIKQLATQLGETGTYHLNKRMANELIFEFEQRLTESGLE